MTVRTVRGVPHGRPTLIDIRRHIEGLATEDGQYYLRCGRTGDQPVPAVGNRFPDREAVRAAARATEQYRSALRRYDPRLPYYDLIVCQDAVRPEQATKPGGPPAGGSTPSGDGSTPAHGPNPDRSDLVEFCHRVAGAVFETLAESEDDDVEGAVMDAYFELAERVRDPDELCLCLLEGMSGELDDRVGPADQADILTDAAARLEPPSGDGDPLDSTNGDADPLDAASGDDDPVGATLSALEARGLIDRYSGPQGSVDADGGARSVVVGIDGYALEPRDGHLPVLPLTFELLRHRPRRVPSSVEVVSVDGGWRVTFGLGETTTRNGLVSAPIDGGTRT